MCFGPRGKTYRPAARAVFADKNIPPRFLLLGGIAVMSSLLNVLRYSVFLRASLLETLATFLS